MIERLGFLFAGVRKYANISYEQITELSPKINIESVKTWEQGDNTNILLWEIQELLDIVGLDIEFGFSLDQESKKNLQKNLVDIPIDDIWKSQILPKITDETMEITIFIALAKNRLDELENFINCRTNYNVIKLESHIEGRIDSSIYELVIRLK